MPKHSASSRWCYVSRESFDWNAYLRETGAVAAPANCFRQSEQPPEMRFQENMKLVTVDPRNQNSWCIATVITVQGPRMRLRMDGLDNMNDVFKLCDAEDIRSITWAKERPHMIVPPLGFLPRITLWQTFLQSRLESSDAAPDNCFIPAPPAKVTGKFVVGHKLEAVDPKNPAIVCVGTVSQVSHDRIRVDLDGWRASYDYPLLSRDIFPVGWCSRAEMSLQAPGPQVAISLPSQSPDKPHNQSASKSRTSLPPQQQTFTPEMRKRRKSSESSVSSLKQTGEQSSSDTSVSRKAVKPGRKPKPVKDDSAELVKLEEDSKTDQKTSANGENLTTEETKKTTDENVNVPMNQIAPASINKQLDDLLTFSTDASCGVDGETAKKKQCFEGISAADGDLGTASPAISLPPTDGTASGEEAAATPGEKFLMFFNTNCHIGPYLSSRRISKQPKHFGPSLPSTVVQEMLSVITNSANETADVCHLIGQALVDSKFPNPKGSMLPQPLTFSESSSDANSPIGATEVWRLAAQLAHQLQCCQNVFSQIRLTKACADCQRAGLVRRTAGNAANASTIDGGAVNSTTAQSNSNSLANGLLVVPGPQHSYQPRPGNGVPTDSSQKGLNFLRSPQQNVPPDFSGLVIPGRATGSTDAAPSPNGSLGGASSGRVKRQWPSASSSSSHHPSPTLKTNGRTDSPLHATSSSTSMLWLSNISGSSVSEWSIDEVYDFLARNPDPSLAQHAESFRKNEIDGKALLLLTSDSILKYMGLKLGPSLKLGHLIDRLRVGSGNRPSAGSSHRSDGKHH